MGVAITLSSRPLVSGHLAGGDEMGARAAVLAIAGALAFGTTVALAEDNPSELLPTHVGELEMHALDPSSAAGTEFAEAALSGSLFGSGVDLTAILKLLDIDETEFHALSTYSFDLERMQVASQAGTLSDDDLERYNTELIGVVALKLGDASADDFVDSLLVFGADAFAGAELIEVAGRRYWETPGTYGGDGDDWLLLYPNGDVVYMVFSEGSGPTKLQALAALPTPIEDE